jgi:hypothetical protein
VRRGTRTPDQDGDAAAYLAPLQDVNRAVLYGQISFSPAFAPAAVRCKVLKTWTARPFRDVFFEQASSLKTPMQKTRIRVAEFRHIRYDEHS